jgi:transposase
MLGDHSLHLGTVQDHLYITDPVALYFAEHFEICRLCDRNRHNAVGDRFMSELIDQLLQEGRLVSAETTHGAGIRTATARELKDYRKPVEQIAEQLTMI